MCSVEFEKTPALWSDTISSGMYITVEYWYDGDGILRVVPKNIATSYDLPVLLPSGLIIRKLKTQKQ